MKINTKLPKNLIIIIIVFCALTSGASYIIEFGDLIRTINMNVLISLMTFAIAPLIFAVLGIIIVRIINLINKKKCDWGKVYIYSLLIITAFPVSNALIKVSNNNFSIFIPFFIVIAVIKILELNYKRDISLNE